LTAELERNPQGYIILNPVGHDSRFWSKGRRHLGRMLDAIERLSPSGEFFTKNDLRDASGAAMPAVHDLLSKLADYGKIETIRSDELRANAHDVCPAPARYRLKPGADLSRFREIANAQRSQPNGEISTE
jgi:hypothetical protein